MNKVEYIAELPPSREREEPKAAEISDHVLNVIDIPFMYWNPATGKIEILTKDWPALAAVGMAVWGDLGLARMWFDNPVTGPATAYALDKLGGSRMYAMQRWGATDGYGIYKDVKAEVAKEVAPYWERAKAAAEAAGASAATMKDSLNECGRKLAVHENHITDLRLSEVLDSEKFEDLYKKIADLKADLEAKSAHRYSSRHVGGLKHGS